MRFTFLSFGFWDAFDFGTSQVAFFTNSPRLHHVITADGVDRRCRICGNGPAMSVGNPVTD